MSAGVKLYGHAHTNSDILETTQFANRNWGTEP